MLKPGRAVISLLALVLAGCASGPPRKIVRVPDWEREDLAAAAAMAPPPVAAPAPAPVPTPTPSPNNEGHETWVPLYRWCKSNGLPLPTRVTTSSSPAFALNAANGALLLHTASQTAYWDGIDLRLGYAPLLIDDQPFVHTLDLKKTIQPLLKGSPLCLTRTNRVIVIDPGHGGENAGTRSVLANGYEKDFTLDWARRLSDLLVTNGWQVFLTRNNDTDLALSNRVACADVHKADLFLSLHFNSAAPDRSQAGLETYCLTPAGMPSTLTRGLSDDLALVFPNNSYDVQNLQLALRIHRALLGVNGNHDRGIRRARFLGVLRGQQRPAILIEGGYLSNPHEARLIAEPAYRQSLAGAVARALE